MTNYTPITDGESPAHDAINQRLLSLDTAVTLKASGFAGMTMLYGGSSAPAGWLVCDGSAVSRATYAALFAAIGTTWGAGDGSTTFNLPDMRGRTVGGAGTGSGLSARTLAQQVGEENHQLTAAEMASHSHSVTTTASNSGTSGSNLFDDTGTNPQTGSTGSDTPHNNMQPSLVLNWIIKT